MNKYIVTVLLTCFLMACGMKGPLYLPDQSHVKKSPSLSQTKERKNLDATPTSLS